MKEIKGFFNKWRPLSNFWENDVEYDGLTYCSVEAAFQAAKTLDYIERTKFTKLSPKEAKRLGRRMKLREDWESVKEDIMYNIVKNKFANNDYLCNLLLSTDDAYLEETNSWHDNFWGKCTCSKCIDKEGVNKLGNILMKIREELK